MIVNEALHNQVSLEFISFSLSKGRDYNKLVF